MAASLTASRSIKEIRNLLVCDICKKTISEPKKLSCSHSFCKACVENLTTKDEEKNVDSDGKLKLKLKCPTAICGKETTLKPDETVAALEDDKYIINLLAAVGPNRHQQPVPVCGKCKKKPSILICPECSENLLCHECYMIHESWEELKKHLALSIDQILNWDEQNRIGAEELKCTRHAETAATFYCETCNELICGKPCLGFAHTKPGHACIGTHEIFLKQQAVVKSKCATIDAMLQQGNKELESVKNNKAKYEKTAEDIKLKHIARKDEIMKDVEDRINKILEEKIQEVDKVYDPACQSLSTQSEKISTYLEKVEKSLQRTNDVLENSKLKELLTAQKVIDVDIQKLRNEMPPNLTTFQAKIANPKSCMEKLCFCNMFKKLAEENCPPPPPPPPPPDPLPLMSNTLILKGEKELAKHLLIFLNYRESPLRLCYRASLHGWQSQKFHQFCDGKTGTVVLVKVGHWIFGGYTDQTWDGTSSGQYKTSYGSFLFSLRNPNNLQPFKCSLVNGRNAYAIWCNPSYGATFGGGHDFVIADNANSNQGSSSNLGFTYQPPAGYQYNTSQTKSLFAGSQYFTPSEIEVFY